MRQLLPRGLTPLPSLRALLALLPARRAEEPLLLTRYGKAECSLCDKAKVPVARIVQFSGGRIAAEWVDIERDPALQARWGERIPVICAGETVLAEGRSARCGCAGAPRRPRAPHPE